MFHQIRKISRSHRPQKEGNSSVCYVGSLVTCLVLLTTLQPPARAATASSPAHVIFFGGYGSTVAQMTIWANASSAVTIKAGALYDFTATPINSPHFDRDRVVFDNAKLIQAWAEKISLATNEQFILVGHSSGSAISNAIAAQIRGRSVPLIILDGFMPEPRLRSRAECWSSVDAQNPLKLSLNTLVMRTCTHYREIKVQGCLNSMCLHYALINQSAEQNQVTPNNFRIQGYQKLVPFLGWL